jgi:outer membrane protein
MRKLSLFLAIFIFLSPVFLKAEEISLTLEEAIAIALRDNRDILLKAEDVKKAKEKISEAKAGLLPTLDFTASQALTRGLYAKDIAQTTTQATLKQYLYQGGKTMSTIKQNEAKLKVSQALWDKTKLETLLNVEKAFYTLLLAGEFANLNKNIAQNTQAHLDTQEARYLTGQASESDILNLKQSLSAVREAYEASINQLEAAAALLRNLLYLDEAIKINPAGQFIYEPKAVAYDEGFLKALENRPEIRQYAAQEEADKKAIEVAKADNRPDIYASWDYYSRSRGSTAMARDWNDYNVIGLTFSWPIFDGWATRAKVEQAIIDLKATRLSQEKAIRDIALELKNAYLDLKNAIAEMKSADAQIQAYKDTLSVMQDKYKAGIASDLDLNDASLGYEVSLFNQKQTIYDYILAQACFDKATGGI